MTLEVLDIELVGSRVTCTPPPTDTDQDVLILVSPDRFWEAVVHFENMGFELGGSHIEPAEDYPLDTWEGFHSYKKDDVNVILTCCEEFFDKFMIATAIAAGMNLLLKEDRIKLFQKILYGAE
jgi:hypothetical protein